MSYSGEYKLYLFCDHAEHTLQDDGVFSGTTQGAAILKARAAGWYVAQKGTRCLCPQHNTRENKP